MQLKPANRGFTMVEVMITVFVVAIGLLSAAALQATAKKAAIDAIQRSTASTLSLEILERMRANREVLSLYAVSGVSAEPTAQTCDETTPCTREQLVIHDLNQWWRSLDGANEQVVDGSGSGATRSNAGGLRSPVGCITRVAGTCRVTVAIAWRGSGPLAQGDSSNPSDPGNNTCGSSTADYHDPNGAAGNYDFRRVMVVVANVGAGTECGP